MGEFNVDKTTGGLDPTAGMPETYPAEQVMMSDGVTSVEDALAEKADTDLVASDFDATASYTAGNYCIYEGKFYRFKNNHSGAWSASDADEIKIAGELSSIKSGLTNYATLTVQTPDTAGSISSGTELPSGYTQSNCIVDQCYVDTYGRRYLGDLLISEKITIFMNNGNLYISTDSATSSSWLGVNVVVILRKL